MNSVLFRAADSILPDERETRLLRAATGSGPEAVRAWRDFEGGGGDVRAFMEAGRGELGRLAPCLYRRLGADGGEASGVSSQARMYLLAVCREECRRQRSLEETTHAVLTTLTRIGVEPLVLKGAALGPWLYGDPALRPARSLELLLASGTDLARAARALEDLGQRRARTPGLAPDEAVLVDPRGPAVQLRTRLFRQRALRAREREVRDRSRPAEIAGVAVRTSSPEDHLVHVLGEAAFRRRRPSPLWASDALLLLGAAPELDWRYVTSAAAYARTLIPTYVMLRYLQRELGAEIARRALPLLYARAWDGGLLERDLALYAVRTAAGGTSSLLRAQRRWWDRLELVRLVAFPSAPYLRQAAGYPRPWPLLAARIARPVRWSLARRRARRSASRGGPRAAVGHVVPAGTR